MIRDKEPEDDLHWEKILTHLSIVDYILDPVCTTDYVSMLAEDFLVEFKDLNPDRPLTTKMHFFYPLANLDEMVKKIFIPQCYIILRA